jgi:hypothetical protein
MYLMLMSKSGKRQVFNRSGHEEKKALLQAVLAQLSCANPFLLIAPKLSVQKHLRAQQIKLKERFAAATESGCGMVTMKDLLAMGSSYWHNLRPGCNAQGDRGGVPTCHFNSSSVKRGG